MIAAVTASSLVRWGRLPVPLPVFEASRLQQNRASGSAVFEDRVGLRSLGQREGPPDRWSNDATLYGPEQVGNAGAILGDVSHVRSQARTGQEEGLLIKRSH